MAVRDKIEADIKAIFPGWDIAVQMNDKRLARIIDIVLDAVDVSMEQVEDDAIRKKAMSYENRYGQERK